MQGLTTNAHRGLQRLIGTGTVAVERDGETVDDEAGHGEGVVDQSSALCGIIETSLLPSSACAMTNSFVKNISRYGALLLTVGLTIWLEFIFTIEWSSPYCMSQEDGPGYAAFGMPLPYMQFSGASSLEYEFMPHIFLMNLIVLCAILFPAIRWAFGRSSLTPSTRRWFAVAGFVLLVARASMLTLSISIGMLNPTVSIGSLYEPYRDFRPVGFCLNDGHYDCKPSPYWFPEGWKHD